jgi:hypothetical protein
MPEPYPERGLPWRSEGRLVRASEQRPEEGHYARAEEDRPDDSGREGAFTAKRKIYASGDTSTPLLDADADLRENAGDTVGVVRLATDYSLAPQIYEDDYEDDISPPARGKTRLRVIHAVPDVAEVDISSSEGTSLFTDLGFPNTTGYVQVLARTYTFEARPAGEEAVAFTIPDGTFSPGVVYSALVTGQAAAWKVELLITGYAGGATGKQKGTKLLPILANPEIIPLRRASSTPEPGRMPPALLLLPVASIVVFLLFSAVRFRGGWRG